MRLLVRSGKTVVNLTKREESTLQMATELLQVLDKHLDGGAQKAAKEAVTAMESLRQCLTTPPPY